MNRGLGLLRVLPLMIVFAIVGGNILLAYSADKKDRRDDLLSKARYYNLEGIRLSAENREAEAHEYYKKAYSLDSTYSEAAWNYGLSRLMVKSDTMQSETELLRSMAMMKRFVEEHPADYHEGEYYAYVATQLLSAREAIKEYERVLEHTADRAKILSQIAELNMRIDSLSGAMDALDMLEKEEGNSAQLALTRASYYLYDKDTVNAIKVFDRLIAEKPADAIPLFLKGSLMQNINRNDSAMYYFKKTEELNPEFGQVKLALANLYNAEGDSVNYDKKMYEALLSGDFSLDDKLATIADYLQSLISGKGDTERGDTLFDVLLREYPNNARVLAMDARYNAAKGNFGKAVESISFAIDLDKGNADYWESKLRFLIADDKAADAVSIYEESKDAVVPTHNIRILGTLAYQLDKKLDKALEIYGDILADVAPGYQYPDSLNTEAFENSLTRDQRQKISDIYCEMAMAMQNSPDPEDARGAYRIALKYDIGNALAANNLAYDLCEHTDHLEEAEELSKLALNVASDNYTYIDTYAWILFKKGDYKKALEYEDKAMKSMEEIKEQYGEEPADSELFDHYGDILYMNQRPEEAVKYWEKALEYDPDNKLIKKKVDNKTHYFK